MASDSDTESESEASVFEWEADDFARVSSTQYASASQGTAEEANFSLHDVQLAVEDLCAIDLGAVEYDTTLHNIIQRVANTILWFLDGVESAASFGDATGNQNETELHRTMGLLVQSSFMSLLFKFRQIFHQIAARDIHYSGAPSTVVCWVDVVLSKLGTAVVYLIGKFCHDTNHKEPIFLTLNKQKESDLLYAAVQLPDNWDAVPNVINAEHASPAAKRLSLQLTFAVYVMGLKLGNPDPTGDQKNDLMRVLELYMSRTDIVDRDAGHSYADLHSTEQALHEKLRCAMILSLFAAVEPALPDDGCSTFRPHTQATLLQYMTTVMYHDKFSVSAHDLITPCSTLDVAQTILLQWARIAPWCWFLCDDPRIAKSEVVDYVTVNWLRHFGNNQDEDEEYADNSEDHYEKLTSVVCSNPRAAIATMNRILHCAVSVQLATPPVFLAQPSVDVLRKICWIAERLLHVQLKDVDMLSFYGALVRLFSLLRESKVDIAVKDLILECLTHATQETLLQAMTSILDDPKVNFTPRIEEKVLGLSRLAADEGRRSGLRRENLAPFRQILHFITILWHSEVKAALRRQVILPFLQALIDWLAAELPNTECSLMLRDSLLTTLTVSEGVLRSDGEDDLWSSDAVWQLAMESPSTDLFVASSFAAYVSATAQSCNQDGLACAEAWDHLRDVLLLVFSHQFLGDEEPLALLVCPTVCEALSSLMRSASATTARYVVSSPWTMNLCAELQRLKDTGGSDGSTYASVLRDRALPFAESLLLDIAQILRSRNAPQAKHVRKNSARTCLIACQFASVPRLILGVVVTDVAPNQFHSAS